MRVLLMAGVAALVGVAQAADVYKYRDASGRIIYSDSPPPKVRGAEKLPAVPTPPPTVRPTDGGAADRATAQDSAKSTAPKTLAERELESRQRREAEQEKARKAEQEAQQAAMRKQNCDAAQRQIAAIESGQRLARFNEKGEREFLDDAARARELDAARKAAADWCK
ncbi:MAG: hypothetical protein IOMNBAOH_02563 [Rhodocyclaceae bacterium]|nr:hypothetical protein [Rhodocyclaceae bacterium]